MSSGMALAKVGIAAVLGIGVLVFLNSGRGKTETPPAPSVLTTPEGPIDPGPAAMAPIPTPAAMDPVAVEQAGLSAEDAAFLDAVVKGLQGSHAQLAEADFRRLESLFEAWRDNPSIRAILVEASFRRAAARIAERRFAESATVLERIKVIDPQEARVYEFETSVRLQAGDWKGAEASARRFESMAGQRSIQVALQLALALSRLDQVDEALTILDRPAFQACDAGALSSDLAVICPQARDLRAQLGRLMAAEAGKDMLQSERFAVRFDGKTQMGIARDVLFVLDRAYARLAEIYNHRPGTKIPVILHSSDDYYAKTGAPRWSGGQYSSHDGNIQIPIRGLSSTLPRDMENVLVHELSHAFADDMSGGLTPRDLNEGLAQYMEGQRFEQAMDAAALKRLATSRSTSVGSFYMLSLMISQQLVQSRGQGAINDLLHAMRETGSADGGFQRVYGKTYADLRKDILETFWRRYS